MIEVIRLLVKQVFLLRVDEVLRYGETKCPMNKDEYDVFMQRLKELETALAACVKRYVEDTPHEIQVEISWCEPGIHKENRSWVKLRGVDKCSTREADVLVCAPFADLVSESLLILVGPLRTTYFFNINDNGAHPLRTAACKYEAQWTGNIRSE